MYIPTGRYDTYILEIAIYKLLFYVQILLFAQKNEQWYLKGAASVS